MKIVNTSLICEFLERYPNATKVFATWNKVIETKEWSDFQELHEAFPTAKEDEGKTVFCIGSGSYFVVTFVDYRRRKLFIRNIFNHADYEPKSP